MTRKHHQVKNEITQIFIEKWSISGKCIENIKIQNLTIIFLTHFMQEKYDRQIRLWGITGQEAINQAVIVSLGSGSIAAELLKNMALHAVGKILIIDDALVTEKDLQENFYIEQESLGQPRADEIARNINEINPDPQIITVHKSPNDLESLNHELVNENAFIVSYDNQSPEFLTKLSDFVREHHCRQMHIQISGLLGTFYLDAGNHYSFEGGFQATKTWNDFRIEKPFPALKSYFESFDLDNLPDDKHAMVPFIVYLYHARQILLKELQKDSLTYGDKEKIADIIRKMERQEDAEPGITEALENAMQAIKDGIPPATRQAFEIADQFPETEPFWRLVRATRAFYEKHGSIPHDGVTPDIDTTTEEYKKVKEIYKKKSEEDWQEVFADFGDIPEDFKRRFAKNIYTISGKLYPPIKESINMIATDSDYLLFMDNQADAIATRNAFIASRAFFAANQRNPTENDLEAITNISKELGIPENASTKHILEHMLRFHGKGIPSFIATISAFAAQELTKAIIHQQLTCDPVFVFDGIHCIGN